MDICAVRWTRCSEKGGEFMSHSLSAWELPGFTFYFHILLFWLMVCRPKTLERTHGSIFSIVCSIFECRRVMTSMRCCGNSVAHVANGLEFPLVSTQPRSILWRLHKAGSFLHVLGPDWLQVKLIVNSILLLIRMVSAERQMLSHDDLMAIIFSSLAAGRPAKQPARHWETKIDSIMAAGFLGGSWMT